MEMSSKKPVSRFRQIVEIPKSVNILNSFFLNLTIIIIMYNNFLFKNKNKK
jgi:hypothetical protein